MDVTEISTFTYPYYRDRHTPPSHEQSKSFLPHVPKHGDHSTTGTSKTDARQRRLTHLLIRLVGTLRVANLALQVTALILNEVSDTSKVRELRVCVNVHLHGAVPDRRLDFFFRGTRATMEDQEKRLGILAIQLFSSVFLVLAEEFGMQTNVARLVYSVDISKCRGDGEVRADLGKRGENVVYVLRLCVKRGVVHTCIVDAVLLATGDTNLHLKPDIEFGHFGKILDACLDVLLLRFLGEIKHMRAEEWFTVLLIILFVGLEHAIKPRQQLLGTMVGMEDDWTKNMHIH